MAQCFYISKRGLWWIAESSDANPFFGDLRIISRDPFGLKKRLDPSLVRLLKGGAPQIFWQDKHGGFASTDTDDKQIDTSALSFISSLLFKLGF